MNDLTISIIQSDIVWENKEKNLSAFADKISAIRDSTDLIILPEMFSTGFSMNTMALGESASGTTVQWMQQMAQQKKCVITGSFICSENGQFFNRLIWMNTNGDFSVYDKRHLFSMGEENKHYHAGNQKLLVELNGWKILPLICYDLRFPAWSRNTKNNPFDLMIYVANWPEKRAYAWKTLLPARAIENQCYVAGVNRVGKDGNNFNHSGDSAIIDFKGEIISNTKAFQEKTETITLHKENLIRFRKEFPALQDTDDFEIK